MSSQQQKKILAVFGVTGYQGGSIVQHFHNDTSSPYSIHALTRDPTSAKAQSLSSAGISVHRADLNDASSLSIALTGVSAVFLVTDFAAAMSAETEMQQAKNAFEVIASIGTIEHVIWSSLPSITEATGGRYKNMLAFDGKAKVTKWVKEELPDVWRKTTELWLGTYFQLFVQFPLVFAPRRVAKEDGEDVWGMVVPADENLIWPLVDVRDTALAVDGILKKGVKELSGRTVTLIADDETPLSEQVRLWGDVVGKKTTWKQVSREEFVEYLDGVGLPAAMSENCADAIYAYRDFHGRIYRGEKIVMAQDILPEGQRLTTWEDYVKEENWTAGLAA